MLASSIPAKFQIPWANGAGGSFIRTIPQASQIGIQNGAASLTDGFPPLTFQPIASGGTPPFGEDMNGILKQITQWNRWQAAGGTAQFDGTFSAAVTGYPAGAVINSTTSGLLWYNTVDNNVTDPDGGSPAGWLAMGPRGGQRQTGNYAVASGTNTYAVVLSPAPLSYAELTGVPIRVNFVNGMTGNSASLNINALGAKNLLRPNLGQQTLFFGDIPSNSILEVLYDGTEFQIPALLAAANAGSGLARTTAVPNTNTPTAIFAAVQGTAVVAFDYGSGNAFSDFVCFYQGGAISVTLGSVGAPGTRTYSLAASVLQLALTGAPGAATVTPSIIQSVGPTP